MDLEIVRRDGLHSWTVVEREATGKGPGMTWCSDVPGASALHCDRLAPDWSQADTRDICVPDTLRAFI